MDLATDQFRVITQSVVEDDAFWAWAAIETLRHTGVRAEELTELTHLALVSYKLPETGEIVPLLQIVPSKTNEERLLLVSPELASVLATIVKRLRDANDGKIPLSPATTTTSTSPARSSPTSSSAGPTGKRRS